MLHLRPHRFRGDLWIPKYHWFPFFVWCISGSRSPLRFFVDDGASMMLASTIVPVFNRLRSTQSGALTPPRRADPPCPDRSRCSTTCTDMGAWTNAANHGQRDAGGRTHWWCTALGRLCAPREGTLDSWRMRSLPGQLLPGNQPLHLLQENLPARPPLLRIVLQLRESHLKLHGPLTTPRSFHTMKLHPSCSELP